MHSSFAKTRDHTSRVDLVVTDLDGTLWDATEKVHQRTLYSLHELASRGVPVVVATGRTLHAARELLASNGLSLPIIGLDGALGQDFTGERSFHRAPFSRRDGAKVLSVLESERLEPLLYVDDPPVDSHIRPGAVLLPGQSEYMGTRLRRQPLQETVATEFVYGFVSYGPLASLQRAARRAGPFGTAILIRQALFGGPALTIHPRQTSKWEGVRSFCREERLDPTRVLAVANGENDIELLVGAAVSCVVSDGCAEALALADHVIDPAENGGWAAIMDLIRP